MSNLKDNHKITLEELIDFTISQSMLDSVAQQTTAISDDSQLLNLVLRRTEDKQELLKRKIEFCKKYKIRNNLSFIEIDFEIGKIYEEALKERAAELLRERAEQLANASPADKEIIEKMQNDPDIAVKRCRVCGAVGMSLTPSCFADGQLEIITLKG